MGSTLLVGSLEIDAHIGVHDYYPTSRNRLMIRMAYFMMGSVRSSI
jgi:hypothetical protein